MPGNEVELGKELELTKEERTLIETLRGIKVDFGRIPCIIYIQDGKLFRIEMETAIKSTKL